MVELNAGPRDTLFELEALFRGGLARAVGTAGAAGESGGRGWGGCSVRRGWRVWWGCVGRGGDRGAWGYGSTTR